METGRVGGGARQSCSVALERVGTRSVVERFGEKCRDRKGMTRLQSGGLGGGKGGCQTNKAVVVSADWGLPLTGLPLPKLGIRTGRAVENVEGHWVLVRQYFPAFVGLGTIIQGRS